MENQIEGGAGKGKIKIGGEKSSFSKISKEMQFFYL